MSRHPQPQWRLWRPAFSALTLAVLAACGGGGTEDPPANQAASNIAAAGGQASRQALALETALASGYGTLEISPGVCVANAVNTSCSTQASVRLDQGGTGQIDTSLIYSSSGTATPPVSVSIVVWQLEASGWVAETQQRNYTLQADGSFTLTGGRYGSAGWTGRLEGRDLAGTPLADWPGVPAGTPGNFPAGAQTLALQGEMTAPRWRLTESSTNITLAGYVGLRLTPTDAQLPTLTLQVRTDNPAALAYTFDAALADQGSVTVWRLVNGALQRLGSGHYSVSTVHGQELLTVDSLDAEVQAALDADSLARYQRGERHIAAWASARLRTGSYLPAGPDTDQMPRLNRTAIDAVLTALGLGTPTKPASPVPGDKVYVGTPSTPGTIFIPGDSVTPGTGSGGVISAGGTLGNTSVGRGTVTGASGSVGGYVISTGGSIGLSGGGTPITVIDASRPSGGSNPGTSAVGP